MTDLSSVLHSKLPLAAWVIDIESATVPLLNCAAKKLLKGSLEDINSRQRTLCGALKKRFSLYLESHKQGHLLPFMWLFKSKEGKYFNVIGSVITLENGRKGLSLEAHPASHLLASSADGVDQDGVTSVDFLTQFTTLPVAMFDRSGTQIGSSHCFTNQFGEVKHIQELFAAAGAANHFMRRFSEHSCLSQEIRLVTKNGIRWHLIEVSLDAKTGHFYLVTQDIQEKRDHEIDVYRLNNYDALTNLPNRKLLYQQLENALFNAIKRNRQFGLLYLDLDDFKVINDHFGHRVGDELIQQVAERIKSSIPAEACLYRLGGDEFVVVMENTKSLTELERLAEMIMQNAAQTYPVAKMEMMITASIGIASYPQHANDVDNLLKNADAAMYRAKSAGHNLYRIYENDMADNINAHLTLGGGLRKGIEEEQFVLYYQPKIRLPDETVVGAEALIRWIHPELGMISPDQFIPLAEESGLILPLGEWVIRRACRQLQEWREAGHAPIRLSVNLSSRQFMQANLVSMVERVLCETGVDPQYLELELTESMLMVDAQQSIEKLHSFRKLGLTLSIDDFGTGYSSLAYLKKLPIQTLKIDRSFINDLGIDDDNDTIVKATISMANNLNLKVIAEGVESRSQVDALNGYECAEVQGYLFAKPLASTEFLSYIMQHGVSNHQMRMM